MTPEPRLGPRLEAIIERVLYRELRRRLEANPEWPRGVKPARRSAVRPA